MKAISCQFCPRNQQIMMVMYSTLCVFVNKNFCPTQVEHIASPASAHTTLRTLHHTDLKTEEWLVIAAGYDWCQISIVYGNGEAKRHTISDNQWRRQACQITHRKHIYKQTETQFKYQIVGVLVKPRNCILHFFLEATEMIYFDLKSDAEYWTLCQGKTRNKAFTNLWILFFSFSKNCCRVSVIIFALQKTVQVDTMFYPDTNEMQMWNNVTLDCPLDNIALKSISVRCPTCNQR